MEELLIFLNSLQPLSQELIDYLFHYIKTREVPAGSYLLKEGSTCDKICFVAKGLFRTFYTIDDQEVNTWFMKEKDVMVSVLSFFDQIPSYEYIQALEDSTVCYLFYHEYQFLKTHYADFSALRGDLLEKYYKQRERLTVALLKKKAVERFQFLYETQKEILDRIPNKYLASYMGMNASTFCRVKSAYFTKYENHEKKG